MLQQMGGMGAFHNMMKTLNEADSKNPGGLPDFRKLLEGMPGMGGPPPSKGRKR